MRLLEHEAKTLLRANHIAVPDGVVVTKNTPKTVSLPAVLKSQVPTGGRGKAGGVVVVTTTDDYQQAIDRLRSLAIKGYVPQVILAEERLSVDKEHYLSLLIDRNSASIQLIAHKDGGVDVEENNLAGFFTSPLDTASLNETSQKLADYLDYPNTIIEPLLTRLFAVFVSNDATLLEINPLVYTTHHKLICGDAKMELDDAASFRHSDWHFEATPQDTNFVVLDANGTVATIANGAGLAMATVDAVAASGMTPANFLDIGGGANTESVLRAFRRIEAFPHIQAIVINIFAGITRCDEVAQAIIQAKKQIATLPPLFIRLAGTNFEKAVALLAQEDITTLASLEECLQAAKEATHA